jgi:hypothetical protein
VYLTIDAAAMLVTCIVAFWGKYEMLCKSCIAIEISNTFLYVPAIEFKFIISDIKYLVLERRPPCQFIVNKVIEFTYSPE